MPEADTILDMRCLENPFWQPQLRELSGLDMEVRAYILSVPQCSDYLQRLTELLCLQVRMAAQRGADCLRIAVGCTGGRHRSVTAALLLERAFREQGWEVLLSHRDLEKC